MSIVNSEGFRKKYAEQIREFRLPMFSRVCTNCSNLTEPGERKCRAFPNGIPLEIWTGENNHTKPVAGDNGILFEKLDTKYAA
jgi:hypothetical protein